MTDAHTVRTAAHGVDSLITCDGLVRTFHVKNVEVPALQGLDLLVELGEMIAIVGKSGSGKSTLLNVLSGMDLPTSGAARVAGWDLLSMSTADRLSYRRTVVGFVRHNSGRNLLPSVTARENVMLPMAHGRVTGRERVNRAMEILDILGMADKATRLPEQLSDGEQQRVAIAAALANLPIVLFADEPTSELDSAAGNDVFEALRNANRALGATVVVATHDSNASREVQRTVGIRSGRAASEVVRRSQMAADGRPEVISEEYAVLDRTGRLQLRQEYRKSLEAKSRVRLEPDVDHLGERDGSIPPRAKANPSATPPPTPVAAGQAEPFTLPAIQEPPVPVRSAEPRLHFTDAQSRPNAAEQAAQVRAGNPLSPYVDQHLAGEDPTTGIEKYEPKPPAKRRSTRREKKS